MGLEAQEGEPDLHSSLAGLSLPPPFEDGEAAQRGTVAGPQPHSPYKAEPGLTLVCLTPKPLSVGPGPCSPATLTLGGTPGLGGPSLGEHLFTFTVLVRRSTQRGRTPKITQRAPPSPPEPSPQGLLVLTASLGQRPHFVHVGLAVRAVHLHHDIVLVCACLVWAPRRGGWWEAAPSQHGLCGGTSQVRGGLDPWEGANGVLVDQGQVGIQRPLGARVGRGDGGVDGGGGRVLR